MRQLYTPMEPLSGVSRNESEGQILDGSTRDMERTTSSNVATDALQSSTLVVLNSQNNSNNIHDINNNNNNDDDDDDDSNNINNVHNSNYNPHNNNSSSTNPFRFLMPLIPRRLSSFLRHASPIHLLRHPVFLMFTIAISLSILSVMYSMRSFVDLVKPNTHRSQANHFNHNVNTQQPSQQMINTIPELIPQAAIITVPDTNITLAARPAAFGPQFPEKSTKFWVKHEEGLETGFGLEAGSSSKPSKFNNGDDNGNGTIQTVVLEKYVQLYGYQTGNEQQANDNDKNDNGNDNNEKSKDNFHQKREATRDDDNIFSSEDMMDYAKEYDHLYDSAFASSSASVKKNDNAGTTDAENKKPDSESDSNIESNNDDNDDSNSLESWNGENRLFDLLSFLQGDSATYLQNPDAGGFTGVLGIVNGSACSDPGFENYDISDTISQFSLNDNEANNTSNLVNIDNNNDNDSKNQINNQTFTLFQKQADVPTDFSNYSNICGKIALVERGECSFYQKVLTLQRHGAVAVIVYDNIYRRGLITMFSTMEPDESKIPSVFVSKDSGDVLISVYENWKSRHSEALKKDKTMDSDDKRRKFNENTDLDGPLVTISTIHSNGPVMGPVIFLLVSPLFSLSIIYGIMIFHRQYKKVQERAPKWVVDSLPKRVWVGPGGGAGAETGIEGAVAVTEGVNEDENNIGKFDQNEDQEYKNLGQEPLLSHPGILEEYGNYQEQDQIQEASVGDRGKVFGLLEEGDSDLEETQKKKKQAQQAALANDDENTDDEDNSDEGNESAGLLPTHNDISKSKGKKRYLKPTLAEQLLSEESNDERNLSSSLLAPTEESETNDYSNTDLTSTKNTTSTAIIPKPSDPHEKVWVSSGECIICLEDYESGISVVLHLPCGHEFHETCIRKWLLSRKKTCPICKMDITENVQKKMGFLERWKLKFREWGKDLTSGRNSEEE